MKQCSKCKLVKTRYQFSPTDHHRDGLMSQCKKCRNEGNLATVKKDRRKYRARRKALYDANPSRQRYASIKSLFGITPSQYEGMLAKQNGVCAICRMAETDKNNKALAIDHNCFNGRIRGLLCRKCNTSLGMFRENIEVVQSALDYLESDLAAQTV